MLKLWRWTIKSSETDINCHNIKNITLFCIHISPFSSTISCVLLGRDLKNSSESTSVPSSSRTRVRKWQDNMNALAAWDATQRKPITESHHNPSPEYDQLWTREPKLISKNSLWRCVNMNFTITSQPSSHSPAPAARPERTPPKPAASSGCGCRP